MLFVAVIYQRPERQMCTYVCDTEKEARTFIANYLIEEMRMSGLKISADATYEETIAIYHDKCKDDDRFVEWDIQEHLVQSGRSELVWSEGNMLPN